jgi:hypothetical protein
MVLSCNACEMNDAIRCIAGRASGVNAGSPLSTAEVQHRLMTFVNVTISQWHSRWGLARLTLVGGRVFTRRIEHIFENRMILVMQEVLL